MSDEYDDPPVPEPVSDESGEDAQPSAVDPEAHRKIRNRKKREAMERDEFWRAIFSTETGRREMWGLLSRLHPFNARMGTTPSGAPDERTTWMFLAEQLVGQHIFQEWFGRHPEFVMLMRQENDPAFKKGAN
jgi:hypothetical protein